MLTIESVDKEAALAAAQSAFSVVQRATWPEEVAAPAKQAAHDLLASIAQSFDTTVSTVARRRTLRTAMLRAIELATICDIARAHGLGTEDSLQSAARALSLLGMSYHATSSSPESRL